MWNNFCLWLKVFRHELGSDPYRMWIDGSFVTRIKEPGEIDVVVFVPTEVAKAWKPPLNHLLDPHWKRDYGVSIFMIEMHEQGTPGRFAFEADRAQWLNDFTKDHKSRRTPKPRKGFLEVIYELGAEIDMELKLTQVNYIKARMESLEKTCELIVLHMGRGKEGEFMLMQYQKVRDERFHELVGYIKRIKAPASEKETFITFLAARFHPDHRI